MLHRQSSIAKFLRCSAKYMWDKDLLYLDQEPEEDPIWIKIGVICHRLYEHLSLCGVYPGRVNPYPVSFAVEQMVGEGVEEELARAYANLVEEIVNRNIEECRPNHLMFFAEYTFDICLKKFGVEWPFSGTMDQVWIYEDRIVIRDLKTTSETFQNWRTTRDAQACSYALAASLLWSSDKPIYFIWDTLIKRKLKKIKAEYKRHEVLVSKADQQYIISIMRNIEKAVTHDLFFPNPGRHCRQGKKLCKHWSFCREEASYIG